VLLLVLVLLLSSGVLRRSFTDAHIVWFSKLS
jgi:hypothetical protein